VVTKEATKTLRGGGLTKAKASVPAAAATPLPRTAASPSSVQSAKSSNKRPTPVRPVAKATPTVFEFGKGSSSAGFKASQTVVAKQPGASPKLVAKQPGASPKVERNAEELKKKRAAAAADKHKARMDAIRAKKAGGKLAELQEQRAKAHKRTAKVKDWDAIHARNEAKQESLVDHVARKNAEKAKAAARAAGTPSDKSEKATPEVRCFFKRQESPAVRCFYKAAPKAASPEGPAKRVIVGGKVVTKEATKTLRGGGAAKTLRGGGAAKGSVQAGFRPLAAKENKSPGSVH